MLRFRLDGDILITTESSGGFFYSEPRNFYCDIKEWVRFEVNSKDGKRFAIQKVREDDKPRYLANVERAHIQAREDAESARIAEIRTKEFEAHERLYKNVNRELESYKDSVEHLDNYGDLINKKNIEVNCKYEVYGYKYVDGRPFHNTERGMSNIAKYF